MSKNNGTKNEMTIGDLAQIMTAGFDKTTKETDKKIDDLARIVQDGFLEIKTEIKEVKDNLRDVKSNTENIKADLNKKVDKIEYNTLDYRVERLEKKLA